MTRHKNVQLLKPLQKGKKYNSAGSSCFESTDMTREGRLLGATRKWGLLRLETQGVPLGRSLLGGYGA